MDYYALLEIEEGASREEIKKAFLRLILQTHPDKTNEETEHAQTLIIAYKTLYDPKEKEEYDLKRSKKSNFKQGYVDRSPNILSQTGDEIEVACGQCEMGNRIKLSLLLTYQYYECVACNYNIFITN